MNSIEEMDTIFMNSKNSKTLKPHRLLLNLSNKVNLKWSDKHFALSNLSICYNKKNVKKFCKNNEFKIPAPTWNNKFKWPDGSYSVPHIQDYFEIISIKQWLIIHQ